LSDYYEKTIEKVPSSAVNSENKRRIGKLIASLIVNELLGKISDITETSLRPTDLAGLVSLLESGAITSKIVKDVLVKSIATGKSPVAIIEEEGIEKVDDSDIESIIDKVLTENAKEVERYKNGEKQLFGFFVGQVMRESKGQADPGVVNKLLIEKL
jgi:aspartyl-tRNA(Asn)/glutamyl-tRNA(Gln) amidotransferase subunit B